MTKSGTNNLHGNAFEFVRDKGFNAKDPFAAIDPATGERKDDGLVRNQFGGTLGGPIVRDRLFFFGGYQGTDGQPDAGRQHHLRADGRDAGRRLHDVRVSRMPGARRRAAGRLRQQSHQPARYSVLRR